MEKRLFIVRKIWNETGLDEGVRHPATYLLEAADDIVYLCDDIEDGVKKGYIPWEKEYGAIKRIFGKNEKYKKIFESIEKNQPDPALKDEEKIIARVRLFRNYVQGYLMRTAIKTFFDEYDVIMNGHFGLRDLLEPDLDFVEALKKIAGKYCFACEEVLTLEVVGERVIKELLRISRNMTSYT